MCVKNEKYNYNEEIGIFFLERLEICKKGCIKNNTKEKCQFYCFNAKQYVCCGDKLGQFNFDYDFWVFKGEDRL